MTIATLHADALALVSAQVPTTEEEAGVRQRFLDLLTGDADAARPDNPGAHLTASALVVRADLDRILLCLHGRIGKWVQLGGHCEDGDASVSDAALREAYEESGITGLIIDPAPIDLDIHPVTCRYGASLHYDIRFAVLAPAGAVPVVSSESKELGWFAPDRLPHPLANATARLATTAPARFR